MKHLTDYVTFCVVVAAINAMMGHLSHDWPFWTYMWVGQIAAVSLFVSYQIISEDDSER